MSNAFSSHTLTPPYGHDPTTFSMGKRYRAPNPRALPFVLSSRDSFDKYKFNSRSSTFAISRPLIPTVADSPASLDSLTKLESLALQCSHRDDIARLEKWISQSPNLARLSVSGSGMPSPEKLAMSDSPDDWAHIDLGASSRSSGVRTSPQGTQAGTLLGDRGAADRMGQETQGDGFGFSARMTHAQSLSDHVAGRTRDFNGGGSTFRVHPSDARCGDW